MAIRAIFITVFGCFPVVILAEGNDQIITLHNQPIVVREKVGSTENGQCDANMHTY